MKSTSSTDTRRRDWHCTHRADGVGRCNSALLQPLGQNPDAAALSAGLQARTAEGAGHRCLQCQRLQRPAFTPGMVYMNM